MTSALLLVNSCSDTAGPDLASDARVVVVSPASNSLVPFDSLYVTATIDGSVPLSSVRASLPGAADAPLFHVAGSEWRGTLVVTNVAYGTRTVTVTAIYVAGDTAVTQVQVRRDRPPVLTVTAPLIETVALPRVMVSATCADDGPGGCATITATAGTVGTTVTGGTLAAELDLTSLSGGLTTLNVSATDGAGQVTNAAPIVVWAEVAAGKQEIATVRGVVLDYRDNRVLHVDRNGDSADIRIADVALATDMSLLRLGRVEAVEGALGPTGAILRINYGSGAKPKVMLWDQVTGLTERGHAPVAMRTAGDYALFAVAGQWTRRHLGTGVELAATYGYLDRSGDIALRGQTGGTLANPDSFFVAVLQNGAWRRMDELANPGGGSPYGAEPRSDGARFVFVRHDTTFTRGIETDTGRVVLATGFSAGVSFDVNGSWIAFQRLDNGGVRQAWTRSPGGALSQRTAVAAPVEIVGVGTDGSLAVRYVGEIYYVAPGQSTMRRIGGPGTRVKWDSGRLVFMLGRSVFQAAP
jgi:hypothetical protein